jgi:hypothetical protein
MNKKTICGQPSWPIASSTVEAYVTELGGHLAPVVYDRKGRRIQPFSVAPWCSEPETAGLPPLLQSLRGDFFCMPFGGNDVPFGKEKYPCHGETANRKWKLEGTSRREGRATLHLSLQTKIRPARVDKLITLVDGHNAVYSRHVVSGMKGPISFGHHAMVKFPDEPGSGHLTTSPFEYGLTTPIPTEQPEAGGYSILQTGAKFKSLNRVPMITGQYADLSRYPARKGFEDIVQLVGRPRRPFAWTAVAFPKQRYAWFALKNPEVLKHTLLWISNGGRHYAPWNGRHVSVIGIEELTSYFHYGLAESAKPNEISRSGHETCLRMSPGKPLVVNTIMAVAEIPRSFDRVKSIVPAPGGKAVVLKAASGAAVTVSLDPSFLTAG